MIIRTALHEELPAIVEIYNQGVMTRISTGDTDTVAVAERIEWFDEHQSDAYPLLVAEVNGIVVGWGSLSPYRPGRRAFLRTVEISYYIHNSYKRRGIASGLITSLLKKCSELGSRSVFAIVLSENLASISLLEKFGFEQWGHLPAVAEIDGKKLDHLYYGKTLQQ